MLATEDEDVKKLKQKEKGMRTTDLVAFEQAKWDDPSSWQEDGR